MMMIYNSHYGNPSSIHAKGRDARKYLDESRRQIAQLLGADTHEIIFTVMHQINNTAIKGIVKANEQLGNHVSHRRLNIILCYMFLNNWSEKVLM